MSSTKSEKFGNVQNNLPSTLAFLLHSNKFRPWEKIYINESKIKQKQTKILSKGKNLCFTVTFFWVVFSLYFLHKLSICVHCTLYTVQYTVHCILYIVHCTLYTVQRLKSGCVIHVHLCNIHLSLVYTVHWILYTG